MYRGEAGQGLEGLDGWWGRAPWGLAVAAQWKGIQKPPLLGLRPLEPHKNLGQQIRQ